MPKRPLRHRLGVSKDQRKGKWRPGILPVLPSRLACPHAHGGYVCVGQWLNRLSVDGVPKQTPLSQKGRRSALLQPADEVLENGRMDRPDELHSDIVPVHPADIRLDGIDRVELDPDHFVEARALDEFEPASIGRRVVDVDPVMALTAAPELHFRLKRNPSVAPRKLRPLAALFSVAVHFCRAPKVKQA